MQQQVLTSSLRDPAGFLFTDKGVLYRQVNESGLDDYQALMNSGLYHELVERGWLVEHSELPSTGSPQDVSTRTKLLQPRLLAYITYPYEWCFEQLRDAALLTLRIQRLALDHGMSLKDASAYNIQFDGPRPLLIDTLSFEKYEEGKPWAGYRQFCQHFLAPLSLCAKKDTRLSKLLLANIDGIPLDLASKLLPRRTWLSYSLLAHIHLHALAQKNYSQTNPKVKNRAVNTKISFGQMGALIESLKTAVEKQKWRPPSTEWGNYYNETNYTGTATTTKEQLVADYLKKLPNPLELIQDIGANNGRYSRIAAKYAKLVVSQDIDPIAVSANYRITQEVGLQNILPLELDIVTPTPAIGWENAERDSFSQRRPADALLALALIHHLAISNNIPLDRLASFFARRCKWLIIEFVPKADSQVQILLATRPDIFSEYHEDCFEKVFQKYFHLREKQPIEDSERTLYLMEKR
jgi:ribosomal protein L11 methylase PrmA